MPWLWLIVGGFFEVGFTTSLRFVDGFRNIPWTIAFLVSVAISMALLEVASRQTGVKFQRTQREVEVWMVREKQK